MSYLDNETEDFLTHHISQTRKHIDSLYNELNELDKNERHIKWQIEQAKLELIDADQALTNLLESAI